MSEVMISIRNLQKHYGDLVVLKGIDLDVRRGEKVVVLGPSGSGKSTMLRCVNALEDADGGTIAIDGVENCVAALRDIESGKIHKCFEQFFLQFLLFLLNLQDLRVLNFLMFVIH